ncbi:hypothetical protein CAMGR0001_0153 [Campylobacter gracilis RM3268]|uniref:Uncharacterized protein n=1 Tax=Campylobacter gracilis RM3268 TaxID=553220 RepID=C8PKD7_9BACT|nr:hypothetical protein CAMGR0001_0153 [Campylobacter gracilis RM3268]
MRFLNLALVQVNFKICARAAMLSRRRLSAEQDRCICRFGRCAKREKLLGMELEPVN